MEPFQFWCCDECGDPVGVADGYVIWGKYGSPDFEFRIIHKGVCDDSSMNSSLPLTDFLGPDGLVTLTSMLSYGPVANGEEVEPRSTYPMPNLDAWVDFLRRMQVPNYEQVRLLYRSHESRERFSDCTESYPYLQKSIASILAGD